MYESWDADDRNVRMHLKAPDVDWLHGDGGVVCAPNETAESRHFGFDRVALATPEQVIMAFGACATFTDVDGRSWVRWANDDHLEPYTGDFTQIAARWRPPS